jgi:hypothetical protein
MISGGEGHDARTSLLFIELRQRIERTAKLESAHPLQVFAFKEHFCIEYFVHRAGSDNRSAVGVTQDPLGRVDYIIDGWKGQHH